MNPKSHALARARESLDGLSVGDALGQVYSHRFEVVRERLTEGILPPKPWWYTDDTALAIAIYRNLDEHGVIDQDALALTMAEEFNKDPGRGYGKMARIILQHIYAGRPWREVSQQAFSGGSMGNGAAMRVAPLGAFFADAPEAVAPMARASAEITHSHPEGIAGAVAVALAAATACSSRGLGVEVTRSRMVETILAGTPDGQTREVIVEALRHPWDAPPAEVAARVGNGSLVISSDTVPFCVWNACRCIRDYREAIISTVEVGGDCDTNCAIVGGIVAAHTGTAGIPPEWLQSREPLGLDPELRETPR